MKSATGAGSTLGETAEMLRLYPPRRDRALDEFFMVDGVDKRTKQRKVISMFRKEGGLKFLANNIKAALSLGFLPP